MIGAPSSEIRLSLHAWLLLATNLPSLSEGIAGSKPSTT